LSRMNGNRSSPVLRGDRRSNAAVLPDPTPSERTSVNVGNDPKTLGWTAPKIRSPEAADT
jgi:hypothetical protein